MYKKKENIIKIELDFKDISQLFNPFDPSKLTEKDLNNDVVDFIISYFNEFNFLKRKTRIIIHLPKKNHSKKYYGDTKKAISHFFEHLVKTEDKKINEKIKKGKKELLAGLIILFLALIIKGFINLEGSIVLSLLGEGLTIGGWVAMWNPINTLFYDWFPIKSKRKLYDRISLSKIEFKFH